MPCLVIMCSRSCKNESCAWSMTYVEALRVGEMLFCRLAESFHLYSKRVHFSHGVGFFLLGLDIVSILCAGCAVGKYTRFSCNVQARSIEEVS